MISPRARLVAGPALLVLVVAALLAGCGGSEGTGATATTTTGSVESELQARLGDATDACTDAAAQISNTKLQTAAETACQQLDSELAKDIAGAADQAKGNLDEALDDLAADCQKRAQSLPAGQDVAGSFCSALGSGSG